MPTSTEPKKYCKACGEQIPTNANFCRKCGQKVLTSENNKQQPFFLSSKKWLLAAIGIVLISISIAIFNNFKNIGSSEKSSNKGLISGQKNTPSLPKSVSNINFGSSKGDHNKTILEISKNVVQILCPIDNTEDWSTGSGVVIGNKGLILTNFHVVENTTSNYCILGFTNDISNEPELKYFVDYVDEEDGLFYANQNLDVALLHIVKPVEGYVIPDNFETISIGDSNSIQLNDKIYIIGYPGFGQGTITITEGIMSGRVGNNYIKTSAKIDSGNSGGAAFDANGTLIGIPTYLVEGSMEGLGYLTSINPVKDWIGRGDFNRESNYTETSEALTNKGIQQFKNENYEAALVSFNKAITLDQSNTATWLFKSFSLIYLEQYDSALESINQTLLLSPDLADAWVIKGSILKELGRQAEARTAFKKALVLDPTKKEELAEYTPQEEAFIFTNEQSTYTRESNNAFYINGKTSNNCSSITVEAKSLTDNLYDNYKLANYKYGDTTFHYGIREDWNNLEYGTVEYTLTAYCDGDQVKKATLQIEFNKPTQSIYEGNEGVLAVIEATPDEGTAPLVIQFDGSNSSTFNGRIVSYEWNFGDRSPTTITGAQISHKYNNIGTYTVRLKVVTNQNESGSAEKLVYVR